MRGDSGDGDSGEGLRGDSGGDSRAGMRAIILRGFWGGGRRGEQDKQLVKSHQKRLRANLKLVSQNMEQEKSIKTSARYSIRQILTTLGLIMFSVRYLDSILHIFCYAAVTL